MEIKRIVYGYSSMGMDWILPDGKNEDRVPIDFAFFYISLPQAKVLVDAGCDTMSGFVMYDFITPAEALLREGIHPEDITHIILTHAHHDHMEGIHHFPNAHIIIQELELEKGRKYLLPTHKVTTFASEYTDLAPLKAVHIGGHCPGSSVVEAGSTVLCGDECYSLLNFTLNVPAAKSRNKENNRAFLARYAHWDKRICHQP